MQKTLMDYFQLVLKRKELNKEISGTKGAIFEEYSEDGKYKVNEDDASTTYLIIETVRNVHFKTIKKKKGKVSSEDE